MNPSAWLLYKDGELYTAKLEKDDRGDFYTWKPLYTADKLREVEQQRDELLAALDTVLDAVGALTKRYELQGYGLSEDEIEKVFSVRDSAKVKP